jgi:nicotinamidase-related amidase
VFRSADGATADIPERSGLLLVDVQEGFADASTSGILPRIAQLLDAYRGSFIPVIASRFVNREGSPCRVLLGFDGVRDEPDTALRAEVCVHDPIVLEKSTYAIGEPLTELLRANEVETLVIAGMDTHACVLHEALDAFDRCIRPIVLADLCASGDGLEAHRAAVHILKQAIGVHNVWFGLRQAEVTPPARADRHASRE